MNNTKRTIKYKNNRLYSHYFSKYLNLYEVNKLNKDKSIFTFMVLHKLSFKVITREQPKANNKTLYKVIVKSGNFKEIYDRVIV